MAEVYLTPEESADILELSVYTIVRNRKSMFPNARLRDNSRRKGLRIPASDVLAYAAIQGEDVVERALNRIAQIRIARSERAS